MTDSTNGVREPAHICIERDAPMRFSLVLADLSVERHASLVEVAARIQALRGRSGLSVRPARAVIGDSETFDTFNVFVGGSTDWACAVSLPHDQEADLFSAIRAAASLRAA